MLALGRVDAVLTHRAVGDFVLNRLGLEEVVAVDSPLETRPAYLVFPSAHRLDGLRSSFDEALRDMAADGMLRAIHERYGIVTASP